MPPGGRPWSNSTNQLAEEGKGIRFESWDQTDTIAAGQGEGITIRAPDGKIWTPINARLNVEPMSGGASGDTHRLSVQHEAGSLYTLDAESTYDYRMFYTRLYWRKANNRKEPNDEAAQAQALKTLKIDDTNGLVVSYSNNSSVDQTGDREYRFAFVEETIE